MRLRFVILGVLLCLSTAAAIFAAVTTYHAIQQFRREHALTQSGDVSTIRPWMTVHFIAQTYRVPENYLYQSLHIADPQPVSHATLGVLADHYKRPVNEVIHHIQDAILSYRRQHPRRSASLHTGQLNGAPRAPGGENR